MAALDGLREALRLGMLSSIPPNIRSCVTTTGIGAGGGMMTSGTPLSGGSASISDGDVSTARTPNTSACVSTSLFHTASADSRGGVLHRFVYSNTPKRSWAFFMVSSCGSWDFAVREA